MLGVFCYVLVLAMDYKNLYIFFLFLQLFQILFLQFYLFLILLFHHLIQHIFSFHLKLLLSSQLFKMRVFTWRGVRLVSPTTTKLLATIFVQKTKKLPYLPVRSITQMLLLLHICQKDVVIWKSNRRFRKIYTSQDYSFRCSNCWWY